MIVYRVENSDGYGPYYLSTSLARCMNTAHSCDPANHPVASSDCNYIRLASLISKHGYRCAFKSIDQYRVWFKGYLRRLKASEYKLVTYKVAKKYVAFGKKQVMFIPKFATKLKEYSPLTKVKQCPQPK